MFRSASPAAKAQAADLLAAEGYLFVAPENWRPLRADEGVLRPHHYPVLDRLNGRPYAALIAAGSDGENAPRQITPASPPAGA